MRAMAGRLRLTPLLAFGLLLELILGVAAIWAGISFIVAPDGSGMQMPISWLDRTPFGDYLVPGVILVLVNGVLPLAVVVLALVRSPLASLGMILSGVLLFGWLSIQLALIRIVHPVMHPALYAFSVALVLIGYMAWRGLEQAGTDAEAGAGAA
jgi:hypothetical protein